MATSASGPPRSRPVKRSSGSATVAKPKPRPQPKPQPQEPRAAKALAHGPAPQPVRRPPRGSVSRTSAQRFAARVRARRRRQRLIVVLVLLGLCGGGWAALRSPWATVQQIQVSGTHRIPVAVLRADAATEVGHPMLMARTADVAALIRRQRLIRSVQVRRQWPSTIRITVVEREPVAAVPVVGTKNSNTLVALVDPDGVVVQRVAATAVPVDLPLVQVNPATAGAQALTGCLAVLHSLPSGLANRLKSIGADSPDGIWLRLTDGSRVEWGSSSDSARKAEVLTALLPQHAIDYDVRSPDTPAVRGK